MQAESQRILAEARAEAGEIVSRTRTDAARFADEMKQKARADAEALVKHAERQIEMQTARAVETIRHEAVDLSVAIASKILRRDISKEDNERLIQDTLKEMQSRVVMLARRGPAISTARLAAAPDDRHLGHQLRARQVGLPRDSIPRRSTRCGSSRRRRHGGDESHRQPPAAARPGRAQRPFDALRADEIASIFHTPAPVTRADWVRLAWLGLVGHCFYQYLFVGGLARTSVANGALLVSSTPIVITLPVVRCRARSASARCTGPARCCRCSASTSSSAAARTSAASRCAATRC